MPRDIYGVEIDIAKRISERTPHHPESRRILSEISDEWNQNPNNSGERLAYELDIVFERRDILNGRGPVLCPRCGCEKPDNRKLKRVNDRAIEIKCGLCGCKYTARVVLITTVEINELK